VQVEQSLAQPGQRVNDHAGGVGFHDNTDAVYYKLRFDNIEVTVDEFDE